MVLKAYLVGKYKMEQKIFWVESEAIDYAKSIGAMYYYPIKLLRFKKVKGKVGKL